MTECQIALDDATTQLARQYRIAVNETSGDINADLRISLKIVNALRTRGGLEPLSREHMESYPGQLAPDPND